MSDASVKASLKYHKFLPEELRTCLTIIIAVLGSGNLQNKPIYDVDANLFFKEDPVYFLRERSVEIEQNRLMEIC